MTSNTAIIQDDCLTTPDALISQLTSRWQSAAKRASLEAGSARLVPQCPFRMMSELIWPGSGEWATQCDGIPILVIPDMPADQYLKHLTAMTAYTLAALMEQQPALCSSRASLGLTRVVGLTVAARAGAWAALGAVPAAATVVSTSALRWSAHLQTIIVRPPSLEDHSALWRHFLAITPGIPAALGNMLDQVAGVGPLLFLLGGALHHRSGEVYAMHYMEKEIRSFLRARLTREGAALLQMAHPSTWETLCAAATGGYRVSVIKQVCEDPAFIAQAQMCIASDDLAQLSARLDRLLLTAGGTYTGVQKLPKSARNLHTTAAQADDSNTVIDTEAAGDDVANMNDFADDEAGARTPTAEPYVMTAEHAEAIRAQSKKMREETKKPYSVNMLFDVDETAKF